MLNPVNERALYIEAFIAPPGLVFDGAVGTTFSLDLEFLLQVPYFLSFGEEDVPQAPDPLNFLNSLTEHSEKITVYIQKGRLKVPERNQNPLYGLLEKMVVEIKNGVKGVFHPKVWAIRFTDPEDPDTVYYRLIVLSRNMTLDNCWDLILQLDGKVNNGRRNPIPKNTPLVHFFNSLAALGRGTAANQRTRQTKKFAEELGRVVWENPDGFGDLPSYWQGKDLTFYLPGIDEFEWEIPEDVKKMAVISPFCSDRALQILVKPTTDDGIERILISRPDTLADLTNKTRELFTKCYYLTERSERADGEDINCQIDFLATGLHAKIYLFETFYHQAYTHLVMGSANATNAGLITGANTEFLVELVGRSNQVGNIDTFLGEDGLGPYLTEFEVGDVSEVNKERARIEKILEEARDCLIACDLSLKCAPASPKEGWQLTLTGVSDDFRKQIQGLDEQVRITARSWGGSSQTGTDILGASSNEITLGGALPTALVSAFVSFKIVSGEAGICLNCGLKLPLDGAPENRDAAIMKEVVNNNGGLMRLVDIILGGGQTRTPIGESSKNNGGSTSKCWSAPPGLLERMVVSYSHDPEKFDRLSSLIDKMQPDKQTDNLSPEFVEQWHEFNELWLAFKSAKGK